MCEFISPSSQAFSRMACGQVPSRSYSQATGRISFSAKSCAISRRAICSSVSVKSTTGSSLLGFQIDWSVNCTRSWHARQSDRRAGCAPDRHRRRGRSSPPWSPWPRCSRAGAPYDRIGRGDLTFDRERRRRAGGRSVPRREIRQLLEARNARRIAPARTTVDVEAELAALTRPAVDDALRAEIRSLVEARNARRIARGRPPLDVEAEVERRSIRAGRVASRPCLPCADSTSTSS